MTDNKATFLPIRMPDIGAEGAMMCIASWLTQPGELIEAETLLVEVKLPGCLFVISSECAGIVRTIERHSGDSIQPDDLLCRIEQASDRSKLLPTCNNDRTTGE